MKTETKRILAMFADGKIHVSRDVAYQVMDESFSDMQIIYNCMTRLATKWGYLERMGLVAGGAMNHKAQSYRITQRGLEALEDNRVFRGRGKAKRNTIGRLITFDPEARDGEFYDYKPAPAIRVNAFRNGCASSERI